MYLQDLKIGSSIGIEVERADEYFHLLSQVQDIVSGGDVLVSAPTLNAQYFVFKDSDKVYLRTSTGSQLLRWYCPQPSSLTIEGVRLLSLRSDKKGESFNRREVFRVPVSIDVEFTLEDKTPYQMQVKDISASGIGFITREKLEVGTSLSLRLETSEGVKTLIFAVVVRIVDPDADNKYFTYGAKVLNETSALVRFVSAKQLELLRKRRK